MAEYLIKGESLVAIADEVRELSGKTEEMGIDAMTTNLGETNNEVDVQASLIAQISTILEGKASGSEDSVDFSQIRHTFVFDVNGMGNAVFYVDGWSWADFANSCFNKRSDYYMGLLIELNGDYVIPYGYDRLQLYCQDNGAAGSPVTPDSIIESDNNKLYYFDYIE